MIDFEKSSVFRLSPCKLKDIEPSIEPLLIADERIMYAFKTVRDFVVFTNRRLIASYAL